MKFQPEHYGYAAALLISMVAFSDPEDGQLFIPLVIVIAMLVVPVWALITWQIGRDDIPKGGSHD